MKRYDDLFQRTLGVLSNSRIESNEEIISALDVVRSVKYVMELYNIILVKNPERTIKYLNRSIGYDRFGSKFTKKNLPRVIGMTNSVDEKGDAYIYLFFEDGNTAVLTGDSDRVCVLNSSFVGGDIIDFVSVNKETFNIYLGCLKEFASNYPGMKVNFNKDAKNDIDQVLGDDFLSCRVRVVAPENTHICYTSVADYNLSITKTKKYGELHDYVTFYNEEFLAKTPVNFRDLNPFFKKCISEYFNMIDDNNLTLSK